MRVDSQGPGHCHYHCHCCCCCCWLGLGEAEGHLLGAREACGNSIRINREREHNEHTRGAKKMSMMSVVVVVKFCIYD